VCCLHTVLCMAVVGGAVVVGSTAFGNVRLHGRRLAANLSSSSVVCTRNTSRLHCYEDNITEETVK